MGILGLNNKPFDDMSDMNSRMGGAPQLPPHLPPQVPAQPPPALLDIDGDTDMDTEGEDMESVGSDLSAAGDRNTSTPFKSWTPLRQAVDEPSPKLRPLEPIDDKDDGEYEDEDDDEDEDVPNDDEISIDENDPVFRMDHAIGLNPQESGPGSGAE